MRSMVVIIFVLAIFHRAAPGSFSGNSQTHDVTLVQGASGEEVVHACTDKLDFLSVFPNDFGLLNRIARVESDFGKNYKFGDSARGIWLVPSSSIIFIEENVSNNAITLRAVSLIHKHYGSSFIDFANFDLRIPFHSAIIARLYVTLLFNDSGAPSSIETQAEWWSKFYHSGTNPNQFKTIIENYEQTKECSAKKLDLWFLIDESSSVGDENFQKAIEFVRTMSRKFVISPSFARVGVSLYSSAVTTISKLNQHSNNREFEAALNSAVYHRGRTYSGAAINDVINNGLNEVNGARAYAEGVPRVLVLLTDGYSSDPVETPSERAHSLGISVFAVGVGSGPKSDEIESIASYPSSKFAFIIQDFDNLVTSLVERLSIQLCRVPAYLPVQTSTSLTIPVQSRLYFSIHIHESTYTTMEIAGMSGFGTAYISCFPNPNPFLYLIALPIAPGGAANLSSTVSSFVRSLIKTSSTSQLTTVNFDQDANYVPLFLLFVPSGPENLTLNITISYLPFTTTPETTLQSSSPITPSISVDEYTLEWWENLGIAIAVICGITLFGFICLLFLGLSRSSKPLNCGGGCVTSCCCFIAKSAGY